jgi:hypothetical protein
MTKSAVKSGKFYADMSPKEKADYICRNEPNASRKERQKIIDGSSNLRVHCARHGAFVKFENSDHYPRLPEETGVVAEFLWQYARYEQAVVNVNLTVEFSDGGYVKIFHKDVLIPLYADLVKQLQDDSLELGEHDQDALKKLTRYLDTIYKDLALCQNSTRWEGSRPSQKYITELDNLLKSINSPERLSPPIKALIGGIIGAVVGAVIGAVVGTALTIHLGGAGGVVGAFIGMFKGFSVGTAVFTGAATAGLATGGFLGFFKGRKNQPRDEQNTALHETITSTITKLRDKQESVLR